MLPIVAAANFLINEKFLWYCAIINWDLVDVVVSIVLLSGMVS
jgi:hypothetical protein